MAEIYSCPSFWAEMPAELFNAPTDFFPFTPEAKLCSTTALNSLTRFGLYLGIVLTVITLKPMYIGIPVLTALLAIALFYGMKNQGTLRNGFPLPGIEPRQFHEGFANIEGSNAAEKVIEDIIGVEIRTSPTAANPFMNVLINEISSYPNKPPAKYSASGDVKDQLEAQFQTKVYGDPGDVFNRSQGQREFYTMPSTSIPNDRESYQNWLYRTPGKTCKEGNNKVCKSGTEGSPYVYLNNL
jgi:hypothetical protein